MAGTPLADRVFNEKYKSSRLAAKKAGVRFPSYEVARRQLEQAKLLAMERGEVADLNFFWAAVFQTKDEAR